MPNTSGLTIRPLGQLVQALTRYSQNLYQPPKDTIRGVEPDTWYSPLQPVKPVGPPGIEPRGFQYYAGQNLLWTPRADAEMSAADLKQIAQYPLARIAIENVKDAMCMASWQIQPKPEPGESRKAATKRGIGDKDLLKLNRFFEMPDREHTWPEWLRPLLEDMLVIDAWTILIRKTFSGEIVEMPVLRGESIVRYIDENGFTPLPPEPAYAQLWWGLPLVNLSTDQLIYKPRNIVPRNTIASQLYGMSPTEQLAPEINIGIQRLAFTLAYYTEGSTPGVVQVVPKGTGVEKIAEAMQWMNSELAGNLTKRRQWQLIQGWKDEGKDEQIIFTKEPLLSDPFDELHTRKIFYGYGVSPQRMAKQMNRASAQASQEASETEGLLPYFSSLKSLIDFIIQRRFMLPKYEMVLEPLVEPDQLKQATVLTQYVKEGIMRRNEAREKIGEEQATEPEADMLMVTTGSGAILLGASTQAAAKPGEEGADGVPGKGKGEAGAAAGAGAGASESDDGQGGDGGGVVADGRGNPRKPASANKPNGEGAAKALEAVTQNRPIGFAAGTVESFNDPTVLIERGVLSLPGTQELQSRPGLVSKQAKLRASAITIHPGRLLPSSLLARHKMERELAQTFKTMRRKATKAIAGQLGLPHAHMEKANASATLQAALDSLSNEWMKIAKIARQPLTDTAVAGATKGSLELNITAEDMLGGINEVAGNWADKRAAELVGMKRNAEGVLIPNPSAKWAISDSTRDMLRVIIRDVLESEGPRTLRGLETRIEQAGIFSDTRATMIAKTEISRAQTQGNLLSWKESGLVQEVNWQLASDHDKDDICDELAGAGPYPIMAVPDLPAHPNAVFAGSTFVPYNGITRMVAAEYDGLAITLNAGPYRTTIGPNHPMLTERGLVPAKLLRVGDKLVYDTRSINRASFGESNLNKIPMIEQAFNSLKAIFGDTLIPASSDYFHGDAEFREDKIHVVLPDRKLLHELNSCGLEAFRENGFMGTDVERKLEIALGSHLFRFERILLPSSGGMSGTDVSHFILLEIDSIISERFQGLALDSTTPASLYCSDGFVVSNCTCALVLIEPGATAGEEEE